MDKAPLVSVILPNYNHAPFLKQRLESILSQTFQDFELIILDDASSDDSVEILQEYATHPKVTHFVQNVENSGSPFEQWQKGIGLAKGKYVWIAESDDYCETNLLEKLISPVLEDNEVSLSYCQSLKVNSAGEIKGSWLEQTNFFSNNPFVSNFKMDGPQFIERFLIFKNVIPNVSAVLIRKKSLDKISPLHFSSEMQFNADWFYYLQILCSSKIAFLAEPLNFFRFHRQSFIAKTAKDDMIRSYRKEIETRNLIMEYFTRCELHNYKEVKERSENIKNELRYLIARTYLNTNKMLAITSIFNRPGLLWRLLRNDNPRL